MKNPKTISFCLKNKNYCEIRMLSVGKYNSTCFTNKLGFIVYTIFLKPPINHGFYKSVDNEFSGVQSLLERNLRPSNKTYRFYFRLGL